MTKIRTATRGAAVVAAAAAASASVIGMASVGAVAFASVPGDDGVIHGCYSKSGGAIRVIDASVTSCKQGETAIRWNKEGQAGPVGPQDPPGAAHGGGPRPP